MVSTGIAKALGLLTLPTTPTVKVVDAKELSTKFAPRVY